MNATDQTETTSSGSGEIVRCICRAFYALGIIGIGFQQIVVGDFVPVILPSFPAWMPLHVGWVWTIGMLLIVAGITMLFPRTARTAATWLGFALLAFLILRHIPDQFAAAPYSLGAWTNAFKILTLSGGAFIVAASVPNANPAPKWFAPFGCFALAITCVVFGADHFLYARFVAELVPSWIPGHLFWTYFCGAALIAAGLGMITRILPRLAAGLLGGTIFIWLLVLHIPRAIADPHSGHGNEITSVFEALAFSGIAFLLAFKKPPIYKATSRPL